jgi:TfoX/Sxy family transcriptional regulator of competence genes
MPFDETLGQRLRVAMEAECLHDTLSEKRMFGGLAMMINGNMAVGIVGYNLMVRVGPDAHEECVALPHAGPMDFTGRPMKGFVYVFPEGIATDRELRTWVKRGSNFARSLPPKS